MLAFFLQHTHTHTEKQHLHKSSREKVSALLPRLPLVRTFATTLRLIITCTKLAEDMEIVSSHLAF